MFFEKVSSDGKFVPSDHKKSWSIFALLSVDIDEISNLQTIMKAVITLQATLAKLIPTSAIVNFYAASFAPLMIALPWKMFFSCSSRSDRCMYARPENIFAFGLVY